MHRPCHERDPHSSWPQTRQFRGAISQSQNEGRSEGPGDEGTLRACGAGLVSRLFKRAALHPPTDTLSSHAWEPHSSMIFVPLSNIQSQPIILSGEGDLTPAGEEEVVAWNGLGCLARLVTYGELAFEDDLHLVVRVQVLEFLSLVESEDARRHWLVRVDLL